MFENHLKIGRAKGKLNNNDYKIIKTCEAIIKKHVNQYGTDGLPYKNILQIIEDNAATRTEINTAEQELKQLFEHKQTV